jgi:hypothetical protein
VDFLTGLPYWGIIVVIVLNTIIVSRMDIEVSEQERDEE